MYHECYLIGLAFYDSQDFLYIAFDNIIERNKLLCFKMFLELKNFDSFITLCLNKKLYS
jgi:hypothetical protein